LLIDVGNALACACCVCSWGALCTDLSGSLALAFGHVHTLDVVRTPFRHPKTIESYGTQTQIMVILHLLSSRGSEPNDMWRQIVVIRAPFRHSDTIESDGTQRQIMVILHLLSSRGGEPDDMWRNHMVPHLFFTIQRQSSSIARGDKFWSSARFCYL